MQKREEEEHLKKCRLQNKMFFWGKVQITKQVFFGKSADYKTKYFWIAKQYSLVFRCLDVSAYIGSEGAGHTA